MTEIKPALSAEEWADGRAVIDGVEVTKWGLTGATGLREEDPRWFRALGALALEGLFTWADVDAIRECANGLRSLAAEEYNEVAASMAHRMAETADRASDRLAALLPPREEPRTCPHEHVVDITDASGPPRWMCNDCRAMFDTHPREEPK